MLSSAGKFFADKFRRIIPESFIFAILLTFLAAILAMAWVDAKPFGIIQSWYKGFWSLLAFAMQMVLILVTGYALAISPPITRFLDWLSTKVRTPVGVYLTVTGVGLIFNLISWGWIVLAAVLARELGRRVKGVDYRLLAACVYTTNIIWHGGLSGSIPLVINTPDNFLIKAGVLDSVIPTTITLLSPMNITVAVSLLIILPILMVMLKPKDEDVVEFDDMIEQEHKGAKEMSCSEEADALRLPDKNLSDFLNNNFVIQIVISLMGAWYLIWHFSTKGFDINLNIMNFLFIILGMICHKTPFRYLIAMKRACGNVSGIILQFPFYAGIMGIMIHTGLGKAMAMAIASVATVGTYPFISFLIGGFVNIFVPSGGGEWAVVGPTIVEAAKTLGASMTPDQLTSFIARNAMAVAYGDAWTNMIQPFWTLAFMPIIAAGTKMQARDFMGYTFIVLLCTFFVFAICVTWLPV